MATYHGQIRPEHNDVYSIGSTKVDLNVSKEQQANILADLSNRLKKTIILINSGWIVDGLVICRPGLPKIYHGGSGGGIRVFILSHNEKIEKIEGENSFFEYENVVGKLTITINTPTGTRRIGPVGGGGRHPDECDGRLCPDFTITDLNKTHWNVNWWKDGSPYGSPGFGLLDHLVEDHTSLDEYR